LVSGPDFVSFPRVSPDGTALVWTAWDDPNMPWDGSELWLADLGADLRAELSIASARRIAGGPTESIFQPAWSPAGELQYISDRTGWWNLYKGDVAVLPRPADFGIPQWQFDYATYAFT